MTWPSRSIATNVSGRCWRPAVRAVAWIQGPGVPTAPAALGGVCNLHGTILPVLDVAALLDQPPGPPARQGDGALVLEAEGNVCALRVDQVDHVASLSETDGAVVDAAGRPLTLLDPQRLIRRALEVVTTAAAS